MLTSSDKLKGILPNPDDYDKLVSELGRLPEEALYSGPRVTMEQLYAGVGEADADQFSSAFAQVRLQENFDSITTAIRSLQHSINSVNNSMLEVRTRLNRLETQDRSQIVEGVDRRMHDQYRLFPQ